MSATKRPPPARRDNVKDTYFGTTLVDPYRWMEDYKSQEMLDWIEAQGQYARDYLSSLPQRDAFISHISELTDAAPVLFDFQIVNGRTFYQRRDPGDSVAKICVRLTIDGDEKILFDPNNLGNNVHTAIDRYKASLSGSRIAYCISQGGSEEGTIYIMDVDTGYTHSESIPRQRGQGAIQWLDNTNQFLYSQQPESDDPTDYYCNTRIHLHQIGRDPDADPVVLGSGANPELEFDRIDIPYIKTSKNSHWALGFIRHGAAKEYRILVTPRKNLTNPQSIHWTQVCDMDAQITDCAIYGDNIYLLTHKNASNFKVISVSAENPDMSQAVEIVPESDCTIEEIGAVGKYLVSKDLIKGMGRIRLIHLETGQTKIMPTPFEGNIAQWSAAEDGDKILYMLTTWTKSLRVFTYDINADKSVDTGWMPTSPFESDNLEAYRVMVPSHDGVEVPVSIIHKKGLNRDGTNPAIVMGYGSYGLRMKPGFSPIFMAWYERGGVFAVAHIRGGGELGKDWRDDGRLEKKENTIQDFITAGEYLVKEGYTSPKHLAGIGRSAGGIPACGALVRRPDLFAAMIILVGATNLIRMETTENGPPNVMEYGSVTTPEGFKGLEIMDSYHRVKDGIGYPAVMLTTGLNDPRVVVWMATKMTARLQAASASDNPILMRVEKQGGHGIGSTKQQKDEEFGEIFAFLWDQFGMHN